MHADYSDKEYNKLREALNIQGTIDPKFHSRIVQTRYYVPIQTHA